MEPNDDFDIAGWVGPLIPERARRELKSKQRERRKLRAQGIRTHFEIFPLGSDHVSDAFDRRFEHWPNPADQNPERLLSTLKKLGARANCRVLPLDAYPDPSYDYGAILPLAQALAWALGEGDNIILLCVPGRLAYWQNDHNARVIVHRPNS